MFQQFGLWENIQMATKFYSTGFIWIIKTEHAVLTPDTYQHYISAMKTPLGKSRRNRSQFCSIWMNGLQSSSDNKLFKYGSFMCSASDL